jgi:deazaflavin-dependent oxidoreductase (nitroreductase family)
MWFNPIMEWVLKSPLQGMFSGNTMIIHYIGRKSGKAYHLPVSYLRVNGTLLTVGYKQRTWWRNLRGGTDVKVLLNGNMVPARAQVVEDDQGVVVGLKEIIGDNPGTARMIGIKLDANNQPEPESLQQAARWRAIVRTFFR